MTGPTSEDQRAALVERLTETINGAVVGDAAEAVLALLESGVAGVHLVAGSDLQETVGAVLGQLREARAERDDYRDRYHAAVHQAALDHGAANKLRAEVDRLGNLHAGDLNRVAANHVAEVARLNARLEAREHVLTGERDQARAEAGEAVCRAVHAEAQVAALLPYAWAGAEALDFQEPYGPPSTGGDVYREGAEAMLTRIKSGEFGPLPGGVS